MGDPIRVLAICLVVGSGVTAWRYARSDETTPRQSITTRLGSDTIPTCSITISYDQDMAEIIDALGQAGFYDWVKACEETADAD